MQRYGVQGLLPTGIGVLTIGIIGIGIMCIGVIAVGIIGIGICKEMENKDFTDMTDKCFYASYRCFNCRHYRNCY